MEINGSNVNSLLKQIRYIIILEDTENKVINIIEKLIASGHKMGLVINEHKTKYLVMANNVNVSSNGVQ